MSGRFGRAPVSILAGLAAGALAFWGGRTVAAWWGAESTDDAFLDGPIVPVSARVAGQVKSVLVRQNQVVAKGDVLAELDSADFEVQLARNRAAVEAAEANKKLVESGGRLLRTRIETASAEAAAAAADVAASEAMAARAASDLARMKELEAGKVASRQEYDAAKAAADNTAAALTSAREKLRREQSKLDESKIELSSAENLAEQVFAQAKRSEAERRASELNVGYAVITAPRSGRVTRKSVEPGAFVQPGQQLLSIVPEELWVTANFKETQLEHVAVGGPATVEIDAASGRVLKAHVDSIQAGSGARFSLLPPENAVGNYVKVVQRVPVKLVFDEALPAGRVFGPGMSVVPRVATSAGEAPSWLPPVAAALAGVGIGTLIWRRGRSPAGETGP
jgi:membrane fusion protein, multidrug efflux system